MRYHYSLAAVSGLALALAACGGPAEEEDTADEVAEVSETDAPLTEDGDALDAEADAEGDGEEPSEDEEPAPAPTPTQTATATPTPTPTRAAAPAAPPAAFAQCAICHSVERGEQGIGPSLAGVVGRRAASVSGFSYSPAMRESGLTWNDPTLNRYLGDPAGVVPGTTMALPGISAADRAAIIAYLKTL